jgi:hypothetical protein
MQGIRGPWLINKRLQLCSSETRSAAGDVPLDWVSIAPCPPTSLAASLPTYYTHSLRLTLVSQYHSPGNQQLCVRRYAFRSTTKSISLLPSPISRASQLSLTLSAPRQLLQPLTTPYPQPTHHHQASHPPTMSLSCPTRHTSPNNLTFTILCGSDAATSLHPASHSPPSAPTASKPASTRAPRTRDPFAVRRLPTAAPSAAT